MSEVKSEPAMVVQEGGTSENKEKKPTVILEFIFGAHMTEADADFLVEKIKDTDIYIPEAAGWQAEHLATYQAVVDGNIPESVFDKIIDAQIREEKYFNAKELTILRNSKKKILIIDAPADHPSSLIFQECAISRRDAFNAFLSGDYSIYLSSLRKSFDLQVKSTLLREEYIGKQINEELPLLRTRFPELKDKNEIRVLAFLGAVHTAVHHRAKSDNPSSDVRWSIPDMVHSLQTEIPRRIMNNLPVDEILYARYFVTQILTNHMLRVVSEDYNEVTAVSRFVASKLSLGDIKEIAKRMGSAKSLDSKVGVFFSEIKRRASFSLPRNKKEFNTLLTLFLDQVQQKRTEVITEAQP